MINEYQREIKVLDKSEEEKEFELILSILKARKELEEATKNFEYAEAELIDYYIYQIKANRAKLDYLLKMAKSKGIALDTISRVGIKYSKAI